MKQWQKSWMPKRKEKARFILQKEKRVAERVPIHVPPEVEPENDDFDVNEFLRSNANPVVASVLEILRRAAVRRGYPVMKSRFLYFGDDIHEQSVRERIVATVHRIQRRLLVLAFPSRVWSPILERVDRWRTSGRVDNPGLGGLPVRSAGNNTEHVSRGKSSGCYHLESNFHSETSERSLRD